MYVNSRFHLNSESIQEIKSPLPRAKSNNRPSVKKKISTGTGGI